MEGARERQRDREREREECMKNKSSENVAENDQHNAKKYMFV